MREAPTAIDIPLSALDAAYREQQRTTILRISARSTAAVVRFAAPQKTATSGR